MKNMIRKLPFSLSHTLLSLIAITAFFIYSSDNNQLKAQIVTAKDLTGFMGSGFFIRPDGYFLTAHHVIKRCSGQISITGRYIIQNGRLSDPKPVLGDSFKSAETTLEASRIAVDEQNDIAILKITPALAVDNYVLFRKASKELAAGESIVAGGFNLKDPKKTRLFDAQFKVGTIKNIIAPGEGFEASNNNKPINLLGFGGGPVFDGTGSAIGFVGGNSCRSPDCQAKVLEIRKQLATSSGNATTIDEVEFNKRMDPFWDGTFVMDHIGIKRMLDTNVIGIAEAEGAPADINARNLQNYYAIGSVVCN
jgi:hypothetical protein